RGLVPQICRHLRADPGADRDQRRLADGAGGERDGALQRARAACAAGDVAARARGGMTVTMKTRTWLTWAAIVLLTVLPLWLISAHPGKPGAEALFGGADDRAQQAIGAIAPGYRPWFSPIFSPASDE